MDLFCLLKFPQSLLRPFPVRPSDVVSGWLTEFLISCAPPGVRSLEEAVPTVTVLCAVVVCAAKQSSRLLPALSTQPRSPRKS